MVGLSHFDETQVDFKLSDIKCFIYGGQSSRFWMFRKFINDYDFEKDGNEIPILNWQCLTIQFKHKMTEDLVIDNEK